jgi:uncharacterized protein
LVIVTVICNATPLINFATLDRLDILFSLFGEVVIPNAVYRETTDARFPNSRPVLEAVGAGRLLVRTVPDSDTSLYAALDDGEREVILLAGRTERPRVLLDEGEARKIARSLGLPVTGSLGILLLAKERDIVPRVQPLLDDMIERARYWVARPLYDRILQQAGESEG